MTGGHTGDHAADVPGEVDPPGMGRAKDNQAG